MQKRLPQTVLCQVVRHALRYKNMSSIATIHHPLRNVDAHPGHIRPLVHIFNLIDRPTVHTHAQTQTRIIFQYPANFQRTLHRLLRTLEKNQRHPVARRNGNEFAARLARTELRGFAHDLIELVHDFTLLIDEQF